MTDEPDVPDEQARVAALRAGIALYATGEFHAAHDPWEEVWLDLRQAAADADVDVEATAAADAGAEGVDAADAEAADAADGDGDRLRADELLFHGLIQFTAAQYHARGRNWSGAVGLAASARGYLAGLPDRYRGVDVAAVRAALAALEADPERVERGPAPPLAHEGSPVRPADLTLDGAAMAAEALAEEHGLDPAAVADAARFARAEEAAGRSRFAALLFGLVGEPDPGKRRVVYDRLSGLVDRERRKEEDVKGLF